MKKIIAALSIASYFSLAPFAFASTSINACTSAGVFSVLCQLSENSFGSLIGTLLQLIFVIAIVVALFYLVWGGFKWLTSGGDKAAVAQAREHIVAAIIGLVVIFLAFFILNIVVGYFVPGTSLSNLVLPTL